MDARLSNFFVVLAPSNTAQLSNTGVSLLDLASKAVPLRLRPQASADGLKQREEADQGQPEQVSWRCAVRGARASSLDSAILGVFVPVAGGEGSQDRSLRTGGAGRAPGRRGDPRRHPAVAPRQAAPRSAGKGWSARWTQSDHPERPSSAQGL